MNRYDFIKNTLLFILFFLFQWFAQYAAARLSDGGSKLFHILMYGGFFLRALVWIEILRDMKLISAFSISSLSYLIIPLLSWRFTGEEYKSSYLLGGLLILAGILIFSVGEQREQSPEPAGESL